MAHTRFRLVDQCCACNNCPAPQLGWALQRVRWLPGHRQHSVVIASISWLRSCAHCSAVIRRRLINKLDDALLEHIFGIVVLDERCRTRSLSPHLPATLK